VGMVVIIRHVLNPAKILISRVNIVAEHDD